MFATAARLTRSPQRKGKWLNLFALHEEALGLMPWRIAMRPVRDATSPFRDAFLRLKQHGDEADGDFLACVHAHQKVLEAFAVQEQANEPDSLKAVETCWRDERCPSRLHGGRRPQRLPHVARRCVGAEDLFQRGGFNSDALRLSYTMPVGAKSDCSVRFRVPVASVDVLGNDSYALGDASVMLGHVFGLTREHGYVLQGEMIFDTADRPELGTGKNVFKGSFIYAKFLSDGAIFAPAFVHNVSVSGDSARADVNATTLDFYYVPKLKDPRNLVTYDPSLSVDWENNLQFAGLAITFGRVIGKALGGNAIVLVKPSAFAGDDRPGDWGVELGYKIIGF